MCPPTIVTTFFEPSGSRLALTLYAEGGLPEEMRTVGWMENGEYLEVTLLANRPKA